MNRFANLICASVASVFSLGAQTVTFSQSTTAVVDTIITGATHGLGCKNFGVRLYDNYGTRKNDQIDHWTIDATSYDAHVYFTSTIPAGWSLKLQGCFSLTTASTDFETTISTDGQTAYMCAACTDSSPAVRNWATTNGGPNFNFVGLQSTAVTFNTSGNVYADTLYIWLDPATGHPVVGYGDGNNAGRFSVTGNGASVVYEGGYGYPPRSSVKPLARIAFSNNGTTWLFSAITDDR